MSDTNFRESDVPKEAPAPPEATSDFTPTGRAAMQGKCDAQESQTKAADTQPKLNDTGQPENISVHDHSVDSFSSRTKAKLDQQGLLNNFPEGKNDSGGERGQALAREALNNEPGILKNPDGSDTKIMGAVDGQYDENNHGIDLIAVNDKGVPIPCEVKHQNKPHLNNESLETVRSKDNHDVKQMDDNWIRDRYRKMIANQEKREELSAAGIDPKYLNQKNFAADDSPFWKDILGNKAVIVVNNEGAGSLDKTMQEQCQERGIRQVSCIKPKQQG